MKLYFGINIMSISYLHIAYSAYVVSKLHTTFKNFAFVLFALAGLYG